MQKNGGKEKRELWGDVANKINGDFDGGMEQMWVGIERILRKQAGETNKEMTTLRAQTGRMVGSSRGKR